MAGVEVPSGAIATSLTDLVQSKVAEIGWSSGAEDDSALAQYIVLMLGNDKSKEAIMTELTNDLLGADASKATASQFVDWLFQTVIDLTAQQNGTTANESSGPPASDTNHDQADNMAVDDAADSTLGPQVPTGPKSMREAASSRGRDKRILGQMRNAMDRSSDQSLHRIRGAAGTGRIARTSAEPPKGPRNMTRSTHMNARSAAGGQMSGNPLTHASPNQQMQLMKMLEEQSRMMAQMLGQNGGNMPAINPNFTGGKRQHRPKEGLSLQDRLSRPLGSKGHSRTGSQTMNGDVEMGSVAADNDAAAKVACKFQLRCTSASCPYAHQSPAAPPNTEIDVEDRCTYAAACKNWKCRGRHPSPAQKVQHAATMDCKFYPNCTNSSCPFKHPDTPPCKNGADCPERDSGCQFSHSSVECRFHPCMNKTCRFKHAEGQKGGNVWKPHGTSDRKFVSNEEMQEELIIPGQGQKEGNGPDMVVEESQSMDTGAPGAAAVQQNIIT